MTKKKRKKKRGPTKPEQVEKRVKAAEEFTKLYARAQDRGKQIKPATEGDDLKPYEGDLK